LRIYLLTAKDVKILLCIYICVCKLLCSDNYRQYMKELLYQPQTHLKKYTQDTEMKMFLMQSFVYIYEYILYPVICDAYST
jgi:hypothetical protein